MKLIGRVLLAFVLIFTIQLNADAQTSGKKKYVPPASKETPKEEDNPQQSTKPGTKPANAPEEKKEESKSKLGYGVNLGNIAFAGSAFELGLSPNIAYKLSETFAVGFMLKLNYFYEKYQVSSTMALKYSAFDFGPTVFGRWKPLLKMDNATPFMQGLFLQAEYERSYPARPAYDEFGNIILNDNGTTIKSERIGEDYLYVGFGAASGYPLSTFFSIHYNVIDKLELSRSPFDYRIGFTYNY